MVKGFKYTLEITDDLKTYCLNCLTYFPKGVYKYYRCAKCHQVLIDDRQDGVYK